MGVEVSVDDFGTGYSSLSYLARMQLSELKIDRSFVLELGLTAKSSAIVTAIIALGRALNLRVVAEGVETLRQLEVLQRLGCRLMQGFLFSRPLPAAEIELWRAQTIVARQGAWIGERADEDGDDLTRARLQRVGGVRAAT
jgi:EAL domain-containing protein (putative c-di-GMP-specific phosphodiesterase class I)